MCTFVQQNSETAGFEYDIGRRNKRQSNYSYKLAKRQNVVLDDYGMSFAINIGIWLVSLDCLNILIIDKICDRKCGSRHPRSGIQGGPAK